MLQEEEGDEEEEEADAWVVCCHGNLMAVADSVNGHLHNDHIVSFVCKRTRRHRRRLSYL